MNKWGFTVDNANKVIPSFAIEAIKKGEKSESNGRMEISNYYEMNDVGNEPMGFLGVFWIGIPAGIIIIIIGILF